MLIKRGPAVSVLICVRNNEKYIGNCLQSILNQTYNEFEIIIIDDDSTDSTKRVIDSFHDGKIKYYKNEKWLGITRSRNRSVKLAQGDYLFFTDSDCVVSQNWIEEGLKFLVISDYAGVEGMSYYVSEKYEPTFSDHTYQMVAANI